MNDFMLCFVAVIAIVTAVIVLYVGYATRQRLDKITAEVAALRHEVKANKDDYIDELAKQKQAIITDLLTETKTIEGMFIMLSDSVDNVADHIDKIYGIIHDQKIKS